MTMKLKKFAVIGHPIAHSKSPTIHQAFASQLGFDISYEKLDVNPSSFDEKIHELKEDHFVGLNITLPFKNRAFQISDGVSEISRFTQSVNTISFIHNKIHGDSTDGQGLIEDLKLNKINLKGINILLLGAGGAAQGVIFDLIKSQPNSIIFHNRTVDRAKKMIDDWSVHAKKENTHLALLKAEEINKFDLVINATSAGITGNDLPMPINLFSNKTTYYDMTYGSETAFLKEASKVGARTLDGIGMLICQAAASFKIWHQYEPDVKKVIKLFK
jgi:shikimate dehydrogenase